jgi:hypothetical protein
MLENNDLKASGDDSPTAQINSEQEKIRETVERMKLQNSILKRIIKRIKHKPGTSGSTTLI